MAIDRYFIARNRARADDKRIVFPTAKDTARFGKPLDEYADVRHLQDRADLASRLARRLLGGRSDREVVAEAARLMRLPEPTLKAMYNKAKGRTK